MNQFSLDNLECIGFVKRFRSKRKFLAAFRSSYDFIIAYHGTKLSSSEVKRIKADGLVRTSSEMLILKAKERFILLSDNEFIRQGIADYIDTYFAQKTVITIGQIHFTLDRAPLQDKAYQYLLFGSESLLPLADELKNRFKMNFRRRMSEYGFSTIVKALIPSAYVKDIWINAIFSHLNEGFSESCITFREDIPGVHILDLEIVPKPNDIYQVLYC